MDAVNAFDTMHRQKLKQRDAEMDHIAEDLIAWIKSDSLTERALGLYNENVSSDAAEDGMRCASQLCMVLLQLDTSPKGRAWYEALDLFTPHKKNLVWRMLSLNNREISQEMEVRSSS